VPYVNRYPFHLNDKEWGNLTIKMSDNSPFGIQSYPWAERQTCNRTISLERDGNCFDWGSDFMTLNRITDTFCCKVAIRQLTSYVMVGQISSFFKMLETLFQPSPRGVTRREH
jgi:hypothetical protein